MKYKSLAIMLLISGTQQQTISPLEKTVDLVSGFFDGYGKSDVATDIEKAYKIYNGTYTGSSSTPCGEADIQSLLSQVSTLYSTYEHTPCEKNPDSDPAPLCPSLLSITDTENFLSSTGLYKEMVGIIDTSVKYFNECALPKIESIVEDETLQIIGAVVDSLPYSLAIKEAEDIFMILKHLYDLIEYIDNNDYTNIGWEIGAIAYDLECFFTGKSTLGFLQTNN